VDFVADFLFPYKVAMSSKVGFIVFTGVHLMTDSTPIIFIKK
jgi:quinolinate synthase